MARLASGALRERRTARWPRSRFAGNRARTLGALIYTASEALPVAPRAEIAFATGDAPIRHGAPSTTVLEVGPSTESDGAQGEGGVPTVGVRSCSGRLRPDAKRRPRTPWTRAARPEAFVRRAGHLPHPLQPSARRSRAPLSRIPPLPARPFGTGPWLESTIRTAPCSFPRAGTACGRRSRVRRESRSVRPRPAESTHRQADRAPRAAWGRAGRLPD